MVENQQFPLLCQQLHDQYAFITKLMFPNKDYQKYNLIIRTFIDVIVNTFLPTGKIC